MMQLARGVHHGSKRSPAATAALVALLAPALAGASEHAAAGTGRSVIQQIALCMVVASAMGLLAKLLRQPPLLGYILAGVVIGPLGLGLISDHHDIITLSEIGLILLLFMIGLEIDLKKMRAAGRWVIVPGLLQVPISAAAAWWLLAELERAGLGFGHGAYSRLYVAAAISLSSTMIVVKLLFDRMELDTLPGRITVGILVFQDLWAIIMLAVQPNIDDPRIAGLARTFGTGALLVGVALLASRYVLPALFKRVAQVPELMLVLSLGWCFLVATVAADPRVGLSMEMGALIAGVSLATFPYNPDVVAKAVSIRDFFITLFFVALGMQIPVPDLAALVAAAAVMAVALAVRVCGVFMVLYPLRSGHRASLLATINLSQVSEFALVIATLGIGLGHIEGDTLTILMWAFAVLAVASSYLVAHSHTLQAAVSRALSAVGLRDVGEVRETDGPSAKHTIYLLGFYRVASALLDGLSERRPFMLSSLKVIDFNPVVKQKLDRLGIACVYGDISHRDSLHHAGLEGARVVACTIPDSVLRGTDNLKILSTVRALCPHAKVVVTAQSNSQAAELYAAGADYVIEASRIAGDRLAMLLAEGLSGGFENLAPTARLGPSTRLGILA